MMSVADATETARSSEEAEQPADRSMQTNVHDADIPIGMSRSVIGSVSALPPARARCSHRAGQARAQLALTT